MKNIFILSILFSLGQVGWSQSEHFPLRAEPSQSAKVEQIIGLDTVKLEFSRPNKKGRVFFGELIPWNSVWRTGANASTKLEISEKMKINGLEVPKGKYSLLSIPNEDNWIIILNKNTSLWGHYGYKQEEDLLRFEVKPKQSEEFLETFNIVFKNTTEYDSDIEIGWGNLRVSFKIEIDKMIFDERVMKSIHQKLNDPKAHEDPIISAHVYFFAANYYHETDRDINQALEWMNKAIEIKNVSYFYYYQSEILATMKKYKEAIKASEEGLAIFEKGSNEEWKLKYRHQIKKWEGAMK